jgi:hypothetical protein
MQQMTASAAHEVHAEAKKNADDCLGRTMGACRSEEECGR